MPLRYLFGPVSTAVAGQKLTRVRQAGECLTFNASGDVDLRIGFEDTWEEVCARHPVGWQPDFIALHLPYSLIPECLWSAPVPRVALAGDWNLHWHAYRARLRNCDLVLTDTTGVKVMHGDGIHQARVANLYGLGNDFLPTDHSPLTTHQTRDIDILFAGSLHPAIQRERLAWMTRLAALGERRRVVIRTDVYGDEYRSLLGRARIVFNRSVRGECNQRAFEAAAAGALLFQEADNRELPTYFRDRQHCVYYTADNLHELLEYYLEHEDERRAIAEVSCARVVQFTFENFWQEHLKLIEKELPALQKRMSGTEDGGSRIEDGQTDQSQDSKHGASRRLDASYESLLIRTWEHLSTANEVDPTLVRELQAVTATAPKSGSLHNALGVLAGRKSARSAGDPAAAAIHFRQALEIEPDNVVIGLNLAEALADSRKIPDAVDQARQTVALLDRQAECDARILEESIYPSGFDYGRVEWERAAWENAGATEDEMQAKSNLLRCRLHFLVARRTGDLDHYRIAAELQPDLGALRGAWGFALHRAGRASEAIEPLRREVIENPFDRVAARTLFDALGLVGDEDGRRQLAHDRRFLSRAAPQLVQEEDWFLAARNLPLSPSPILSDNKPGAPTMAAPSRTSPARLEEPISLVSLRIKGDPLRIIWEGSQKTVHSFDMVNREMCRYLIERGNRLSIVAAQAPTDEAYRDPQRELLARASRQPLDGPVDVHIRHGWPPNFTPPPAGHWVIMQPWEFGSVPKSWIEPMSRDADEIWAYTEYVRQCYLEGGVPSDRVKVVPLGVDVGRYRPEAPPFRLRTQKRFKFLFVGGTIPRKGIDVLLNAYTRAFTSQDDVCLVIKDFGAGSFYKGQTAESQIAQCQAPFGAPEMEYIQRSLTEEELAGLYAACNCLVHPYRGEGFGLPIAEAMASGLAVVVTNHGAALDFCNETNAFLIPARIRPFQNPRVGSWETVGVPYWAEPDQKALERILRDVWEHPEETRARGAKARDHICRHFTWDHAAAAVEARVRELRERPIRRFLTRATAKPPVVSFPAHSSRPRVSLCMIVKNEAKTLHACLTSIDDLVDEMVVVDTGSSDNTQDVAMRLGARVVNFSWVDDFSAARNESVRHAQGEWILWLDADERLDQDNRRKTGKLFTSLKDEKAAYVMTQQSVQVDSTRSAMAVPQVRLFRRDHAIHWQYRVHEQILLAIRSANHELRWTDIVILHDGYQNPQQCREKLERNVRLLLLQNADRPDDPITLYHLGWAYEQLGRPWEALPFLRRSLERVPADYSIRPKLHVLVGRGHHRLGQLPEALAACRTGRAQFPHDVELGFLEGLLLHELGDLAGAERCFLEVQKIPPAQSFTSMDSGLRGYKARHELARIYHRQGRNAEAADLWKSVLAEHPDFWPARQGLNELQDSMADVKG